MNTSLGAWSLRVLLILAGAVALILWIVAEAGRDAIYGRAIDFALIGIAIALSGFAARAAVSVVVAGPVMQLIGITPVSSQTDWPSLLLLLIPLAVAAADRDARVRIFAAIGAASAAVLTAAALVFGNLIEEISGRSLYPGSFGVRPFGLSASAQDFGTTLCWTVLACAVAWCLGAALGAWRRGRWAAVALVVARSEVRHREIESRLDAERASISADLHDILAHSLTVVVAQGEGALATGSEASEPALERIVAVSRESLRQLRALIERLDDIDTPPSEPAPGIADIAALLEPVRELGVSIRFQVLGEPTDLQTDRQLAVYRIVQECVTNAVKHAGPSSSLDLTLDWRGSDLAILAASTWTGDHPDLGEGGGAGIPGMVTRARLAGGWLSAGPTDDGFLVTAAIPIVDDATLPAVVAEAGVARS